MNLVRASVVLILTLNSGYLTWEVQQLNVDLCQEGNEELKAEGEKKPENTELNDYGKIICLRKSDISNSLNFR